jgi:hypothetical protein
MVDTSVSRSSAGAPIMDPLRVALRAVTLGAGPLGSINAPVAVNVTAWPAAVTVPRLRSPRAEMETAPPVAVAAVSVSDWLLSRNRPPPAPPFAVRVLTEVRSTAPLVPIPLDAVRTSVSANKLTPLVFAARMAPPALRVTAPKAEIVPTVMSPAVVLTSMSLPVKSDGLL